MSKKQQAKRMREAEKAQYSCKDCAHSYDWHEIGANGKPFMCRCKFYKEGKFSRFLTDPQCNHFILLHKGNTTE